jgi:hypothetical protein
VVVFLFSLERKKKQKSSRQTRSLRAFCRASASTLPKVHLFGEVVCLANNGACAMLMDSE